MSTAKSVPKGLVLPRVESRINDEADFVEAAIRVLDEQGWTTGVWGEPGGPHCVLGAFNQVSHIREGYSALTPDQRLRASILETPESVRLLKIQRNVEYQLVQLLEDQLDFQEKFHLRTVEHSSNFIYRWNDTSQFKLKRPLEFLRRVPKRAKLYNKIIRPTLVQLSDNLRVQD